uniref:Secreted protein n=1 Tax=Triticum urartu TaxID=4572 RepID=A0A8R7TQU8_TRIUA
MGEAGCFLHVMCCCLLWTPWTFLPPLVLLAHQGADHCYVLVYLDKLTQGGHPQAQLHGAMLQRQGQQDSVGTTEDNGLSRCVVVGYSVGPAACSSSAA